MESFESGSVRPRLYFSSPGACIPWGAGPAVPGDTGNLRIKLNVF